MTLRKFFLQLPIKQQILLTIIIVFIINFIIILFFSYTIIDNYIDDKLSIVKYYFYERYLKIIDSHILFINFIFFQLEDTIKIFTEQNYYHLITVSQYSSTQTQQWTTFNKEYNEGLNDYDPNAPDTKKWFYYKFFRPGYYFFFLPSFSAQSKLLFEKLISMRNIRIPYYGHNVPIFNEYLFVKKNLPVGFSINKTYVTDFINDINNNFDIYYNNFKTNYINAYKTILLDFKQDKVKFFDIIFPHNYDVLINMKNKTYMDKYYQNNYDDYIDNVSTRFHFVDFSQNEIGYSGPLDFIRNKVNATLDFIFKELMLYFDIISIPVYPQNDTIMSKDICFYFLMKQIINIDPVKLEKGKKQGKSFNYDDNFFKNLDSKIIKGKTKIWDCFLEENIFYKNDENNYYNLENKINYDFIKITNYSIYSIFYKTKSAYPDISALIQFMPRNFIIRQMNLHSFLSNYIPISYIEHYHSVLKNSGYIIILLIVYIWIFIFVIYVIKIIKVSKQVVEPINELYNAIKEKNINNLKVFDYKLDDDINELFRICKTFLIGESLRSKFKNNYENNNNDDAKDIKYEINNNLIMDFELLEQKVETYEKMKQKKQNKIFEMKRKLNHLRNEKFPFFNMYKTINNPRTFSSKGFEELKADEISEKDSSNTKGNEIINLNEINENEDIYKSLKNIIDFLTYFRKEKRKFNDFRNLFQSKIRHKKSINFSDTKSELISNNKSNNKSINNKTIDNNEDSSNINIIHKLSKVDNYCYIWYMESKFFKNVEFLNGNNL